MIKQIFLLGKISAILLFFYFVINEYISEENKKLINTNRSNLNETLIQNKENLITLKNDTDDVIEFNSGFDLKNTNKPKRNFWQLFSN